LLLAYSTGVFLIPFKQRGFLYLPITNNGLFSPVMLAQTRIVSLSFDILTPYNLQAFKT
jgi:hypothetical protein